MVIKYFYIFFLFIQGLEFIYSQRGHPLLIVDDFLYRKNRGNYWRCIRCSKFKCKSRLILRRNDTPLKVEAHTHGPENEKISWGRRVLQTIKDTNQSIFLNNGKIKLPTRHPHFTVTYLHPGDEDEDHKMVAKFDNQDSYHDIQ